MMTMPWISSSDQKNTRYESNEPVEMLRGHLYPYVSGSVYALCLVKQLKLEMVFFN